MQSTLGREILVIALVVGVWLADDGLSVTHATAAPPEKEDPNSGVTQNWDKVLPAAQRFTVLAGFNNEAVRDNETGLVWERSPASIPKTWVSALNTCISKNVGGRKGWRLPSIPELGSLIDPSVAAPGPTLPVSHPFSNIQSSFYWSATTYAELPANGWGVNFHNGTVTPGVKAGAVPIWCVRGGMNADQY
jgi:Protein of unknown function (DUF1566)